MSLRTGDRLRPLAHRALLRLAGPVVLVAVALGACSLDDPELPDGWERAAIEAARATPGVSDVRLRALRVDSGLGNSNKLSGVVRVAGPDPKATYRRMLVRVTDALGTDINVIVDIKGKPGANDGARAITQSDLGIYIASSRELYAALRGTGPTG